eukprot:2392888-Pleurochrysis_carterae.AAC.1
MQEDQGTGEGGEQHQSKLSRLPLASLLNPCLPLLVELSSCHMPAPRTSPDGSTATQTNCAGVGETSVWKLR